MKQIFINVTPEMKQEFKEMCKARGLSMREWFLTRAMPEIRAYQEDGRRD